MVVHPALRIGVLSILLAGGVEGQSGQVPDALTATLARVVERIDDYYQQAQRILVTETVHIQPLASGFTSAGFGRRLTYDVRIEREEAEAGMVPKARVLRRLMLVNGRAPRKQDEPECMDPESTSEDPLTMLLPAHRKDFTFALADQARLQGQAVNVVEFKSRQTPATRQPRATWKEDCVSIPLEGHVRGVLKIDAESGDVLRLEQHLMGPVDVPPPAERSLNDARWRMLERWDQYINYKRVAFLNPDETLLVPTSIETLSMFRGGGLSNVRTTQVYSNYRRFVAESRILK